MDINESYLNGENADGYSLRRTLNKQEDITVRYPFHQTAG